MSEQPKQPRELRHFLDVGEGAFLQALTKVNREHISADTVGSYYEK